MEKKDKPRICEVLGVEVEERFKSHGYSGTYHVHKSGHVLQENGEWIAAWALADLINNPEKVIKKQCLTDSEIAILRAIPGAKWLSLCRNSKFPRIQLWERKPIDLYGVYQPSGTDGESIAIMRVDCFPSVKPGDLINVEEVLKGEAD